MVFHRKSKIDFLSEQRRKIFRFWSSFNTKLTVPEQDKAIVYHKRYDREISFFNKKETKKNNKTETILQ